jgi:hypothetical protein
VDNIATGLAMIAGLIAGLIVYARKWRPAALYLVLYFGLLVVWAWRTDRFIVPLAPILVPAMLLGWVALARRLSVRAPWVGAALVAVLLLAGSALRTTALVAKGLHCRSSDGWPPSECLNRHAASYFEAMRYIEAEVPSDAIFLTAKSGALWSYTGHRSVSYGGAIAQEPGGFVPFLEEAGVEWILLAYLEQSEPGGLANQLEHNCSALSLVAHFPEQTYLFRRVDPESNTGADDACKAVMSYRAKSSGDVGEEVQTTGGRR